VLPFVGFNLLDSSFLFYSDSPTKSYRVAGLLLPTKKSLAMILYNRLIVRIIGQVIELVRVCL
jgi:hypothetical protein